MDNRILEFECGAIDAQGGFLPEYTGYGQDISPEFVIRNLSPDAKTIAITLEDMSHPIKGFTHWVIWNIPAENVITRAIPAGKSVDIYKNARQGLAYGLHRYAGPKPPKGKSHEMVSHLGEEFGYVLKGTITLVRDSKKYKLKAKDTFYMNGKTSHYLYNHGNAEALVLWVTTPPMF